MKTVIAFFKAGSPWSIIIALLALILAAVPVAAVLGILSMGLDHVYMRGRLVLAMGENMWEQQKNFLLIAIPMFILMGEIILRAGIARRMYEGVAGWLNWLPGGLMHANIASCSIFAATSGSSVATAATIGTVAYPEIENRKYNESLFLGSIAAGGTLGILIPPSINLILYGFITDTSVPELFLAGFIPGMVLSLLFVNIIAIACIFRPRFDGEPAIGSVRQGPLLGLVFLLILNAYLLSLAGLLFIQDLTLNFVLAWVIGVSIFWLIVGNLVSLFAAFSRGATGAEWVSMSMTAWGVRLRGLPDLIPPLILVIGVMGSIYAGIATPTEAAAVGVVFSLFLAVWTRTLSLDMLKGAFESTMRITSMIMLIILAAVFLNFILGFIGVTQALIKFIEDLGWTPLQTMIVLVIFYLILGMFMETLSMMLTTVPVVFPLVVGMGYDPVWFGILVIVLMEAALITPPIGVNLYVVQGIRTLGGKFSDVAWGALPFVLMMILMVILLIAFPGIAIWLPQQFF